MKNKKIYLLLFNIIYIYTHILYIHTYTYTYMQSLTGVSPLIPRY